MTAAFEGSSMPVELGIASWSGGNGGVMQTVSGDITVPEDQTKVILTFTAGVDQAPVVSYIAIEKSSITKVFDDNLSLSVITGGKPALPETVDVETADGERTTKK